MKLSSVTFTWPLLPMDGAAAILSLLGFEYVDISGYTDAPFETITPWQISDDPDGAKAKVNAMQMEHGLQPADYFFSFGEGFRGSPVNHPDPHVRKRNRETFENVVSFCKDLGFSHITLLPGAIWNDLGPERSLELSAEGLSEIVAIGGEAGIPVGIEPHWESVVETIERTQRLLQMVNGLTLTLDYTHFIAQGVEQSEVDVLAPHASHFHARQGAPGHVQMGMDDGTLDYEQIMQVLKGAGYDGFLTLEHTYQEWKSCYKTENISETMRLADQLRELI